MTVYRVKFHFIANYVTTVDYLREERNILQRIGAIGGGVLCGYIIGIRKGFFKRFLYTASGGIAAATVCYPYEAEEYFKQSSQLSKKYVIIGYHFLNGGGCTTDFISKILIKIFTVEILIYNLLFYFSFKRPNRFRITYVPFEIVRSRFTGNILSSHFLLLCTYFPDF